MWISNQITELCQVGSNTKNLSKILICEKLNQYCDSKLKIVDLKNDIRTKHWGCPKWLNKRKLDFFSVRGQVLQMTIREENGAVVEMRKFTSP